MLVPFLILANLVSPGHQQSPQVDAPKLALRWSPYVKLSRGHGNLVVALSEARPEEAKVLPPSLVSPKFGSTWVGPKDTGRSHLVIVDFVSPTDVKLYFDTNANGDFTDDPDAERLKRVSEGEYAGTMYDFPVAVNVRYGTSTRAGFLGFNFYVSAKEKTVNEIGVLPLSGYEGTITLGGEEYACSLETVDATLDFARWKFGTGGVLNIDRNHNKVADSAGEIYRTDRPFKIDGTVYEVRNLKPDGELEIVVSSKKANEEPVPPDLARGTQIPNFSVKTFDGKRVSMPESFKGKVVLLDFWGTFCGPCIQEIPTLKKAYREMHDKGLEILSISADDVGNLGKLHKMIKDNEMNWMQSGDGLGFGSPPVTRLGIGSYPTYLLVDGDTGKICATNDMIRPNIPEAIQRALNKKFKKSAKDGPR